MKKSTSSWGLTVLLVFALSGTLHTVSDIASRIPLEESGSLLFFCTQPLGILAEYAVCKVACRVWGLDYNAPPRWTHVLGYVWVAAWCIWTLPMLAFAQIRIATINEESPLPFSIVGLYK